MYITILVWHIYYYAIVAYTLLYCCTMYIYYYTIVAYILLYKCGKYIIILLQHIIYYYIVLLWHMNKFLVFSNRSIC